MKQLKARADDTQAIETWGDPGETCALLEALESERLAVRSLLANVEQAVYEAAWWGPRFIAFPQRGRGQDVLEVYEQLAELEAQLYATGTFSEIWTEYLWHEVEAQLDKQFKNYRRLHNKLKALKKAVSRESCILGACASEGRSAHRPWLARAHMVPQSDDDEDAALYCDRSRCKKTSGLRYGSHVAESLQAENKNYNRRRWRLAATSHSGCT